MSDDARGRFLKAVGLPNFGEQLLDIEPRTPVDREKLRAYWRHELDKEESERLAWLMATYRVWYEAGMQTMGEANSGVDIGVRPMVDSRSWFATKYASACLAIAATLLACFLFWPRNSFDDGPILVRVVGGEVTGYEAFPQKWQDRAQATLVDGAMSSSVLDYLEEAVPDVKAVRQRSPAILAPYGTAVRSTRPILRWQRLAGMERYDLEICELAGPKLPEPDQQIVGTEYQVQTELARGQIYNWKLLWTNRDGSTSRAPTKEMKPAIFTILSESQLQSLMTAEAQLKDSPFLLMLLYIEYGLVDDAQAQLEVLRRTNRRNSPLSNAIKNAEKAIGL